MTYLEHLSDSSTQEGPAREDHSVEAVPTEARLPEEAPRATRWPGRIGLVLESADLIFELSAAMARIEADCAFRTPASVPVFEVAALVERERADLLFVELARVNGVAAEWMQAVRGGGEMPLIVAVHPTPDPAAMIDAMRAGAFEFVSLPASPGIFEALDRLSMLLESRRTSAHVKARMAGVVSAKGGCGATTVACHLAASLRLQRDTGKVLVADLDSQTPAAHRVFRATPRHRLKDALESVRRLNTACWPEFATPAGSGLDLLAGWNSAEGSAAMPEPWRIESMFRFLSRNYSWVLADLGRNLNPSSWAFIQNLDELLIVTAPDVLALYQTRSILQTLSGRGFDKHKVHLILNRNRKGPQDFWIESIETMFEMKVAGVIADDRQTLERLPRDRFEFPAESAFGRSLLKFAERLTKPAAPDKGRKTT